MAESPDSQTMDPIFDNNKYTEDSEGQSTANTNTTPNSELSPPDSPKVQNAELNKTDAKANSRKLASSLSLEEQVIPVMLFPKLY
jgi:beta-glucosidase